MTKEAFEEKFVAQLNDQQREAVHAVDGAVLLLAVPGSGKTTVLVTRLGYMVCCCGIQPGNILTMTYTVAATEDMKKRFAARFGQEYANRLEFRTINGVSSKIIQYYSENHSRRQAFALLSDDGELNTIVRQIYQAVNDDYAEASLVKDIRANISYIKNMMLTDEEISELDGDVKNLSEIYRRYQEELKRRKAMDYDDQMVYAKRILESCPPVLDHFQERYRYLCVDEAQDTSKIQHAIIQILAQKYGNLFMVGDEDQSIYGFRAAWPDALMRFEEDHPGARVLLMEQNYRSTEEIVAAANAFVSENRFRREKTIRATQGSGEQVRVVTASNREAQYQYLFHAAQTCQSETAALYRNNDSALLLIDLLERGGVPYNARKFEDTFFTHRLINDFRDIIRFASNPTDGQTFLRIYYKFGAPISKQAAQWACQRSGQTSRPIPEELRYAPNLKPYAREAVTDLIQILPRIPHETAASALSSIWYDLRYALYAKKARLDPNKFDILCILAEKEPDADGLLRRLDELKKLIQDHRNSPDNKFILSTIHSSKGLEYETVFLLDVFDGILPSKLPSQEDMQMNTVDMKLYEEERRLYYVGMTRAKRALYLFSCNKLSSFTSEVSATLPKPVLDDSDVFHPLRQNLCGRTYRDSILGEGKIAAQCGETLLVKYPDGQSQLLTLDDMIYRRDRTVQYEAVPHKSASQETALVKSALVKREPSTASRTAWGAMPDLKEDAAPPAEIPLLSIGMEVFHRKFGKGVIESIEDGKISVFFADLDETKRLSLAFSFQSKLLTLD